MAIVIPESAFSSEKIKPGEKKSLRTLQDGLDDSALLWFEPQLADTKRPDIIAYIPALGLLIYEVKDWGVSNIIKAGPDRWQVKRSSIEKVTAPHKQAEGYYYTLNESLKKEKLLLSKDGDYQGKVKIPIASGVIFPNMTRSDYTAKGFDAALGIDHCLFKDDLEAIQQGDEPRKTRDKLKKHFKKAWWPHEELSKQELDLLRGVLYPEITAVQKDKGGKEKPIILDIYQEQIARKILDSGHSIIRGVAGSGKSLVLCAKAIIIARQRPEWRVLITCYNVALASQLRYYINSFTEREGVSLENIQIIHFDKFRSGLGVKWLSKIERKQFKIERKQFLSKPDIAALAKHEQEAELDEMQSKLKGEELKRIAQTKNIDKYNAILVDESQDFHTSWLAALTLFLDERTDFLLLAEDPNQKIYPRSFSYIHAGINTRGNRRSHKLPIGYRSTRDIIVPASRLVVTSKWDEFYERYIKEEGNLDAKEHAMRRGRSPKVTVSGDYGDICRNIATDITGKLNNGYQRSDIGILYLTKTTPPRPESSQQELSLNRTNIDYVGGLRVALAGREIDHFWLAEDQGAKESYDLFMEEVTISTIMSAKGLEFEVVYMVGLELFPWAIRNERENASLLYVAMTRAKSDLNIFSMQHTNYVKKIQTAIDETDS